MSLKVIRYASAAMVAGMGLWGPILAGGTSLAQSTPTSTVPSWAEPTYVFPKPPQGFNPLTATSQQLMTYGFPQKPSGGSKLTAWTKAMAAARNEVPPNPVVGKRPWDWGGLTGYKTTGPWAGYANLASANNDVQYLATSAYWNVSSISGNSNYPSSDWQSAPAVGAWTGIGGTTNPDVIQAGTADIATSTPQYRFWDEDYPNAPIYEGPVVNANQQVYVNVSYDGNGQTSYYMENMATGAYSSFENSSPYYSSTSAEFIVEQGGSYLPDFGSISFTSAQDSWPGVWSNFDSQNYEEYLMTNSSGTTTAEPGAPSNDAFSVYWQAQ